MTDFRGGGDFVDPERAKRDSARMLHWGLRILALGLVVTGVVWGIVTALTSR